MNDQTANPRERLFALRDAARAADVNHMNSEIAEFRKRTGDPAKKRLGGMRLNKKQKRLAGIGAGVLAVICAIGYVVYETQRPTWLLNQYEAAKEDGAYPEAVFAIREYLGYRPQDWERTIEAAELLMLIGNNPQARAYYAKLLAPASPYANDVDLQFYNALALLPNQPTVEKRIDDILKLTNSHIPSLVFRGAVTYDRRDDAEFSAADMAKAIEELDSLSSGHGNYRRFERLLAMMTFVLCRDNARMLDHRHEINPAVLPGQLARESHMLIYGANSAFNINFCGLVGTEIDWFYNFQPDLTAIVNIYRTHASLRHGNEATALEAMQRAADTGEDIPILHMMNGVALGLKGEMDAAFQALTFAATGTTDIPTRFNKSIARLFRDFLSEPNAVVGELDEIIAVQPDHVGALTNKAVLALIDNRLGQARLGLTEALQVDGTDYFANYNFSLIDYLEGNYTNAVLGMSEVLDHADQLPGLHYYRGRSYEALNNIHNAQANYREALVAPFYDSLADIALGDYFIEQELTREVALDHYRNAYDRNPNYATAAFRVATALARNQRSREALDLVAQLEASPPEGDEDAQLEFDELLLATRGQVLLAAGQTAEAEAELRRASKEIKNNRLKVETSIRFARLLLDKGDASSVEEAQVLTRTILPLDPQNTNLLVLRARIMSALGDQEEAKKFIDSALKLNNTDIAALMTRADIMVLEGEWEDAVDLYQSTIFDLDPTNVEPLERALEVLKVKDPNSPDIGDLTMVRDVVLEDNAERRRRGAGIEEVKVAVQRELTDADKRTLRRQITEISELRDSGAILSFSAYIHIGALFEQLGEIDRAIENMLLATRERGGEEMYKPWLNLGNLYTRREEYREADNAYTEAIEENPPELGKVLFLRARVRDNYDPDLANEDYSAVIELYPNDFESHYRRGMNRLEAEDFQNAISDLSVAIRLNPEILSLYQARRKAHLAVGDRASAAKDAEMINLLGSRR